MKRPCILMLAPMLAPMLALCVGCEVTELQTACFGAGEVPDADEVVVRPPRPGVDFDYRPQTRAEAEQAMWDYLHAAFREASDAVICVIDEGSVACESGVLGPEAVHPGRPYWVCRWHHPEEARLSEGTMYFFPTPPSA